MIYEFPDSRDPIRQGDIFLGLPRVEIPFNNLSVVGDGNFPELVDWSTVAREGKSITAILGVRPVAAIVASQDCDALRSPDITLCEIRDFQDVEKSSKDCKNPKQWMKMITQQSRKNLKWFYLPPDAQVGFSRKMAVDFQVTLRVGREDLLGHRNLRRGRLIHEADEHFRERLSEFFRRYPYDEWYPLDQKEFAEYADGSTDIEPRGWQTENQSPSKPS